VLDAKEKTDRTVLDLLREETERFRGTWILEMGANKPSKVLEVARQRAETTVAVGGAVRNPRWLERGPFAKRLLDAGARELLILTRLAEGSSDGSS